MARILLELVVLLLVAWPSCLAVDMTVEEKATGTEVVEATVDLIHESCIFDDDKLILRRIAYVETTDGVDDHTFERNGNDYYGGIWQLDELTFETIRDSDVTVNKYQAILDEFDIDWYDLEYRDLWKPLHCGLAARLWMDIQLPAYPHSELPRNVEDQADFWANYYRTPEDAGSGPEQQYIDKVAEIEYGCEVPRADMLFVLDGSGSIEAGNFILMKEFVKDIVQSSNIGEDDVRVGLIRYSFTSELQFGLGAHSEVDDVVNAIDGVPYTKGSTASDLALNGAVAEFSARARIEAGIPQVCIFMTDGQSDNPQATAQAAYNLHNHPTLRITVFGIGVTSGAVRSELETIGSEPSCIHVYMLESFEDMEPFKAQLQRQACGAPAELDPDEDASGSIDSGSYVYFKLKVKRKGITIKVKMTKGSSRAYVSYTARNPGRVIYDNVMEVDSSKADGKTMGVKFPEDIISVNETDVFLALLGDGFGEQNEYNLGYDDGYSGVAALQPVLMAVLGVSLFALLLRQE